MAKEYSYIRVTIPVFNRKRLNLEVYEIKLRGSGIKEMLMEREFDGREWVDEIVAYS